MKTRYADRVVFLVKYDRKAFRWVILQMPDRILCEKTFYRKIAIRIGAKYARDMRESSGVRTQLVVHNRKNGRISFERTYGDDPHRRKG